MSGHLAHKAKFMCTVEMLFILQGKFGKEFSNCENNFYIKPKAGYYTYQWKGRI